MNIRKTIKKTLKEAVGVVPYIHETAEKIYRSLISSLTNDNWTLSNWKKETEKDFHFSGDFKMGNILFTDVIVTLIINESDGDSIDLEKMAVGLEMERMGDMSLTQKMEDDILSLLIVLDVNYNSSDVTNASSYFGDFISDFLQVKKGLIVSSISHEIKHAYDSKMKERVIPLDRASYRASQNIGVGPVKPMSNFLFGLYYTHFIENSVRPNEIYSLMVLNNITPKKFYEFLTNEKTYQILSEYKNLTYDKFYNQLKNDYMSEIDGFFKHIGFLQYVKMNDDEKVHKFLDFISQGLKNSTIEELEQLVFNSEAESQLARLGLVSRNKMNYMIKNAKIVNKRFSDDGEKMFRSEIKNMNIISDKMIKKISKLYSLVNNKKPDLSKLEKYKRHSK